MGKTLSLMFIILVFSSCNAKRSIVAESHILRNNSSSTAATDSTHLRASAQVEKRVTAVGKENTVAKITEYDSAGNVSKITETIIVSELAVADITTLLGRTEWLSGLSTITVSGQHEEAGSKSSDMTTKDSRPIQGTEWFWPALAIATLILLIYLFRKVSPGWLRGNS